MARAHLLAKESAALTREQRAGMDIELADLMLTAPEKVLEQHARDLAYAYDPAGYLTRHRRAEGERRVSIRPASDAMVYLSALLPMVAGIACYKALQDAADRALASGGQPTSFGQPAPHTDKPSETASNAEEPVVPTRSQLMADELIERLTGRTVANPADIEINLLITPDALLGDGTDPVAPPAGENTDSSKDTPGCQAAAQTGAPPAAGNSTSAPSPTLFQTLAERVATATATLVTEGLDPMTLPAGIAKDHLRGDAATVFLRRVFGTPGHLVAMETKTRTFTGNLRN